MVNAYLAHLICAARNDPTLAAAFLRVNNLADRPADLLRPSLAMRVARGSLRLRDSAWEPDDSGRPAGQLRPTNPAMAADTISPG